MVDVGTCLTDETLSFVLHSPLTTTGLTELAACKSTATTAKRIDVCKIGVFEVRGCGLREDLGIIAFYWGKCTYVGFCELDISHLDLI